MNVSVVVCTFNRAETLRLALESMVEMVIPPDIDWELIVVDNNSDDDTRRVAESMMDRLPLTYLFEGRQGKSFALNTGIAAATGEVLAFTDDDVQVHPDWVAAIWRTFQEADCDGIGGRIIPTWGFEKPDWLEIKGDYSIMAGVIVAYDFGDETREINALPFGANMAFHRRVFDTSGVFDTDLGPAGRGLVLGEDTEFCRRVREDGGVFYYAADAMVYHPVERRRGTKKFCLQWYYAYGKSTVQARPRWEARRWIFGTPAWLFRSLVNSTFAWMFSLNSRARFYHRLTATMRAGQIVGHLSGKRL